MTCGALPRHSARSFRHNSSPRLSSHDHFERLEDYAIGVADVTMYSCTGGSSLFCSPTLCHAMQRTLQVSYPDPASCGRSNVSGPHCCVAIRFLVMEHLVFLRAGLVFLPEGVVPFICDSAAAAAHGPDLVALLHLLEQFAAQAVEQSGCSQPASTRWLRWHCRCRGILVHLRHQLLYILLHRALDKALHLPTRHQLCSTQLL